MIKNVTWFVDDPLEPYKNSKLYRYLESNKNEANWKNQKNYKNLRPRRKSENFHARMKKFAKSDGSLEGQEFK